jgi:hypothetical protein
MLEWIVVGAISINIKAQITKPNQLFIWKYNSLY